MFFTLSRTLWLAGAVALAAAVPASHAAPIVPASLPGTLPANDDQATGPVNIGFAVNWGGTTYSQVSVNSNGNLTFDDGLGLGTPGPLSELGRPIIAPFWADVDTRGAGSSPVTYGSLTVDGRAAFGANYVNVGYAEVATDKLNSFQVLLINRADTGAGNFDVRFNYERILWEAGSYSGGTLGLGGTAALVGLSTTGTADGVTIQLPGSLTAGAFVDGGANSLVAGGQNAQGVAGRYDFTVRGGVVASAIPEPGTVALVGLGLAGLAAVRRRKA